MTKIKLTVLGSCVTREIFTTINNENYKDIYVLGTDVWQTSIPCFLSPPVLGVDRPSGITPFKLKSLKANTRKTSKKIVEEEKPDYIIFDLYADIRYGYAMVGKKFITNNPSTFRKTKFFKEKKYTSLFHSSNPDQFFEVFKIAFSNFIKWKERYLPDTKLILNQFRYANGYLESGTYKTFDNAKFPYIENDLKQFKKLENYIKENYNDRIMILDLTDRLAFGEPNHRSGKTPWHFTKEHFERAMYLLNELIIKDLLNGKS